MNGKRFVTYLAAIVAVSLGPALTATAGEVSFDFESGTPPGTSLAGTATITPTGGVGDSGVLRLTDATNSQNGEFFVDDFVGGAAVSQFEARFNVRLGDSTCCTGDDPPRPRPADGFSFSFGSDFAPGDLSAGESEEGIGSGIIVSFDAWDNGAGAGDTAPAIDLKVGGVIVATQSMAEPRDGGRPPETPLITDPVTGEPMLLTTGADFADVLIRLNSDNTVDVDYKNVNIFNDIPVPGYTPQPGNFVFGARTGGANETHHIDNLNISIIPEPSSLMLLGLMGIVFGVVGVVRRGLARR